MISRWVSRKSGISWSRSIVKPSFSASSWNAR